MQGTKPTSYRTSVPRDPPVQANSVDKPSKYDLDCARAAGVTRDPPMKETDRHMVVGSGKPAKMGKP